MTGILCSMAVMGAPTSASSGITPMSVTLSASSRTGSGATDSISTDAVTATASGGTSPYTYAWALSTGDATTTATNPSSATTAFQRNGCVAGTTYNSSWKCTASDSAGNSKLSSACSAAIERTGTVVVPNWDNVAAVQIVPPSSVTGSNNNQTIGTDGTLNFSNTIAGSRNFTYKVFKNNVDLGQLTSLAVVAADVVYFSFTMVGDPGDYVSGTFTVAGAVSDTFTVNLDLFS